MKKTLISFILLSATLTGWTSAIAQAQPDETQATLNLIFEDAACTRTKAIADEAFQKATATLPAMLRDMAEKVRNDRWTTLGTSGTNWDKAFRIARYRIYSNHLAMSNVIGMNYIFGRLSNPTGVSIGADGEVAILVGDEYDKIPRDEAGQPLAELRAEVVADDSLTMKSEGKQFALHKGLNFVAAEPKSQLYIYYEVRDALDDESRYLDRYPELTIQIAGGEVYGYFDVTRRGIVDDTPTMTDRDWQTMVADSLFRDRQHIQIKHHHVLMSFNPNRLLDIARNHREITPLLKTYEDMVCWEEELMGITPMWDKDDYFYHTAHLGKRHRNLLNATSCAFDFGYMCATSYGTYYNNYSLPQVADADKMLTKGVVSWGPAHEFGHCYQRLLNMVGMTEVSNNLFSNVVTNRFGSTMSRGDAMNVLPAFYAEGRNWIDLGIWPQTQLYWKLYQYFHLAGHQPDFYPRLFDELRKQPFERKQNVATSAANDYLRFARSCCKVANADLSELFECYGYFRELTPTDTVDGKPCHRVSDYGTYYLYVTPEDIQATRAEMQSYDKKLTNLVFIDDRVEPTPSTCVGAAGEIRHPNEKILGSQGAVGQWTTFDDANYKPAQRDKATWGVNADSTIDVVLTPKAGAVGYKVYDKSGRLVTFSTFSRFTLPREITAKNIKCYTFAVADAKGNDAKLTLKRDKTIGTQALMRDIFNCPIADSTDYRLQLAIAHDFLLSAGKSPRRWRIITQDGKIILRSNDQYVRIVFNDKGGYALNFTPNASEASAFTVKKGELAYTYILDINNYFNKPENAILLTPMP